MVLGLIDQQQIFWQLHLIELLVLFIGLGAIQAVTIDISKAFDRVWHAGLLHKPKSYGISDKIFGLISSFRSNRRLRVVLHGKSSQEYPVNAGSPRASLLALHFSYYTLLTFLMMLSVILLSMLTILLSTPTG